jgi:hypothetical protein
VFADISQNLYQGGLVRQQKELEEVNSDIEQQKISVDLYQIKNRINELFFGILLIQEQRRQNELVKQDIGSGLKKTRTAIANGVALRSAADVLEAELLRAEEGNIELASAERSYKNILGLFIDSAVNDNSVLEKPLINIQGGNVTRPELTLLNYQKHGIEVNRAVLSARKKPRFDLFVQGGYGRPGLNMLENEFNLYYLGGVRFSWSLSGFYTFTREKQILTLKEQSLDVQKETFLFNTSLSLNQYEAEIAKLQRLLLVDDEIIKLQTRIKETASVQLEAGVISPTDYIRELNSEDQAKQNRVLHETQLLMAKAKYQFNRGN